MTLKIYDEKSCPPSLSGFCTVHCAKVKYFRKRQMISTACQTMPKAIFHLVLNRRVIGTLLPCKAQSKLLNCNCAGFGLHSFHISPLGLHRNYNLKTSSFLVCQTGSIPPKCYSSVLAVIVVYKQRCHSLLWKWAPKFNHVDEWVHMLKVKFRLFWLHSNECKSKVKAQRLQICSCNL